MAAPADLCHYEALPEVLAVVNQTPPPDDLPPCPEPAAYVVVVLGARTGQSVDINTRMCGEHRRQASRRPGYIRSHPLAAPLHDPEPIGVVEGSTAAEQYDTAYQRYEADD